MSQLFKIISDFLFVISPSKISVGLGEACFCERFHHFGTSKGFGQEDHFRMPALHFVDQPFPEKDGFGVRIVNAEAGYSVFCPEDQDTKELLP